MWVFVKALVVLSYNICSLIKWSHWSHISRAESPWLHILEFKWAVVTCSDKADTAPSWGSCFSSSIPSSCIGFSTTGFLLGCLAWQISSEILWSANNILFLRATQSGAGSTLMVANGLSNSQSSMCRWIHASASVSWCSLATRHVTVYEVTHSCRMKISCQLRLRMSAANCSPATGGGSHIQWVMISAGIVMRYHPYDSFGMALSKSIA